MKSALRYGIPLILATLLLWFVFKDIDLIAMLERLRDAEPGWIVLSCVILLLAHLIRAWRWQMLLEPIGTKPGLFNSFVAVLTGYFANYIFPRMGEVTRAGTLYKLEGIPVNAGFGTVVAERIFDMIVLLVLIGINFLLEFQRLSGFFEELIASKLPQGGGRLLVFGGVTFLVGLGGSAWWLWKNEELRTKLMENTIVRKVVVFAQGMLEGLLSVRKLRSPGLFILSTVLIWVNYYFASYVLFYCIPETSQLGWLAGLTVLVIGALGMAVPTQGGIGAYHLLVGNVMILYGLSLGEGVTLATFIHGTQMILMLLVGALAFLVVMFKNNRKAVPRGEHLV